MKYYLSILFLLYTGFNVSAQILVNDQKLIIEEFGKGINTKYEELNPILIPDGNTIFFCRSNADKNIGIDDIWISHRDEDGNWLPAEHAGEVLNRGESNFVCSVSPEGRSILFVTEYETENGRASGLFISNLEKFGWSEPKPIFI